MDRHPQLGGGHEGGERVLEGGELGGGGRAGDITEWMDRAQTLFSQQ